MKKRIKAVTAGVAVMAVIGTGTAWYLLKPEPIYDTPVPTDKALEEQAVTVKINTDAQPPVVYEKIIDEDTGKEVIAEVQRNEPVKAKTAKAPEKPKAQGSYNNPDTPPTYSQEQTVVEEKTNQQTTQTAKSDSENVYVEGFGYVEQGGSTQSQTGQSTGDINKMVGIMD